MVVHERYAEGLEGLDAREHVAGVLDALARKALLEKAYWDRASRGLELDLARGAFA